MKFSSVGEPERTPAKLRYLAICASVVPVWFLGTFLLLTLRSIPETDDFCFSDQAGFFETVIQWYRYVGGRVVPLSLMQIPAKLGRVIGVDYFSFYELFLLLLAVCFVLAMLFVMRRLWPHKSRSEQLFFGFLFAAILVSTAPSPREMLYWLPGVTCYTIPEALVILIVAELSIALFDQRRLDAATIYWLAAACAIASLCNEFTPVWVLGWILGSFLLRWLTQRANLQALEHAILASVTVATGAVVLFAPGNAVRRAQYSAGGALEQSLQLAVSDFTQSINHVFAAPEVIIWLVGVAAFSMSKPEWRQARLGHLVVVSVYLLFGAALCAYVAHFIGRYSAAENLASRARNEVEGLLIAGLTFSVCFASSWLGARIRDVLPRTQLLGSALAALIVVALSGASWWALSDGAAAQRLGRDRASVGPFWLASMARHARLSLPGDKDVLVSPLLVFPPLLANQDLVENPDRLPNDCIARFYGKQTVRLRIEPPTEFLAAFSRFLPGLQRNIGQMPAGEIRLSDLNNRSIEVPQTLVQGPNLSTPWGSMRLVREGALMQFDLDRLPASVCVPLYRGLGDIRGIDKIEPTSLAAGFEDAPVSEESAVKACSLRTEFIRFLVSAPAGDR
jgi:hypothetical protein